MQLQNSETSCLDLLLKPEREVGQPKGHTPWVGQACGEIRDCRLAGKTWHLKYEHFC
jgi:hypothetical protein